MKKKSNELKNGDVIIVILPFYLKCITGISGAIGVVDSPIRCNDLAVAFYIDNTKKLVPRRFLPVHELVDFEYVCPIFEYPNILYNVTKVQALIEKLAEDKWAADKTMRDEENNATS